PQEERSHRPVRVDLLCAIAHANEARLAAGARTAVARSVGIEQRDLPPGPRELVGGPRPEAAGTHDDDGIHHAILVRYASVGRRLSGATTNRLQLLWTPNKVGRPKGGKARRVKVLRLKGENFRLRTPSALDLPAFPPFRLPAVLRRCLAGA